MRILKCEAQTTNAFFVTVNQMFGSSSQLPTHAVIKQLSIDNGTVLGNSRKLGRAAEHLNGGSENAFVG